MREFKQDGYYMPDFSGLIRESEPYVTLDFSSLIKESEPYVTPDFGGLIRDTQPNSAFNCSQLGEMNEIQSTSCTDGESLQSTKHKDGDSKMLQGHEWPSYSQYIRDCVASYWRGYIYGSSALFSTLDVPMVRVKRGGIRMKFDEREEECGVLKKKRKVKSEFVQKLAEQRDKTYAYMAMILMKILNGDLPGIALSKDAYLDAEDALGFREFGRIYVLPEKTFKFLKSEADQAGYCTNIGSRGEFERYLYRERLLTTQSNQICIVKARKKKTIAGKRQDFWIFWQCDLQNGVKGDRQRIECGGVS